MFVKTDHTSLVLRPRTHCTGGISKRSSFSAIGVQFRPIRHQNGVSFKKLFKPGEFGKALASHFRVYGYHFENGLLALFKPEEFKKRRIFSSSCGRTTF